MDVSIRVHDDIRRKWEHKYPVVSHKRDLSDPEDIELWLRQPAKNWVLKGFQSENWSKMTWNIIFWFPTKKNAEILIRIAQKPTSTTCQQEIGGISCKMRGKMIFT